MSRGITYCQPVHGSHDALAQEVIGLRHSGHCSAPITMLPPCLGWLGGGPLSPPSPPPPPPAGGPPAGVAAAPRAPPPPAAGGGHHGETDEQGRQPDRTQTMHLSRTSCSEFWVRRPPRPGTLAIAERHPGRGALAALHGTPTLGAPPTLSASG